MISNNPPVINAGADYTIPKGTAFVLKGTGTDATGDVLTYTWEQNDAAVTSSGDKVWLLLQNLMVLCFDLYILVSSVRYMPPYSNVLSNKLRSKWESV
jgi:hypothetical protein